MNTIDRITTYVAAFGVLLSALAFAWSTAAGIGALAGAAVAIADWMVTRFLGARILAAGDRGRTVLSLALVGKMGLVLAAVAGAIVLTRVHPVGFLVGISALFAGIVAGGLHSTLTTVPTAVLPAAEPSEIK